MNNRFLLGFLAGYGDSGSGQYDGYMTAYQKQAKCPCGDHDTQEEHDEALEGSPRDSGPMKGYKTSLIR